MNEAPASTPFFRFDPPGTRMSFSGRAQPLIRCNPKHSTLLGKCTAAAIAAIALLGIASRASAQMSCSEISPRTLELATLPAVTKVGGPSCRFTSVERSPENGAAGTLDIFWNKAQNVSHPEFDKIAKDFVAKFNQKCQTPITHLGDRSSFCNTRPWTSWGDSTLYILRGSTLLTLEFQNWPSAAHTITEAEELAIDVFGHPASPETLEKPD